MGAGMQTRCCADSQCQERCACVDVDDARSVPSSSGSTTVGGTTSDRKDRRPLIALNSATSRADCELGRTDVLQRETAFQIWDAEEDLGVREDTTFSDALRLTELQDWAAGKAPVQLPLERILAAQYALCHKLVEQDEQIRLILQSSKEDDGQTQGLPRSGAEGPSELTGATPAVPVITPTARRPVMDAITSAAATGAPLRPPCTSGPMGSLDPRLGPHVRAFSEALEMPPLPRARGARKDGSAKGAPNLIRSTSSRWWKERTDSSAFSAFSEDTLGYFSSEIEQAASAAQASNNLRRSPPADDRSDRAALFAKVQCKGEDFGSRRFAIAAEPSQESPVALASLVPPTTDASMPMPRQATSKRDEKQAIIHLIRQVASNAGVGQHASNAGPVDNSPADTEVLGESRFI